MKKYILIIAVFFTIGISGCKKDYLSLEVNPNAPSVATPGLLLSGALVTAASNVEGPNYAEYGVWVGWFSPSGNFVPVSPLQQFQITNQSFTAPWTFLYQNLTNFNNLQISAAADPSQANFQAIAMIMKAYDFEQLVDQFGDVPYTQAFHPSTILFPAYDNQQAIYNDLVKQLDGAISLINGHTTAANPGKADVVFGGNMTGWKKFANTLKLRMAIRQSNLATNAAKDDLAATAGEGYLDETMDAEVNPGYSNSLGFGVSQQNPFWANYGDDTNGNPTGANVFVRGGTFYINTLNNFNDPRVNMINFTTSGSGGTAVGGNVLGDTKTTKANPLTSAIGPGLLISPSQNAYLMSSAEALFLTSEALIDGYSITAGTSKTAQSAYEAGITASFVAMKAGSVTTFDPASTTWSTVYASAATSTALAAAYYGQSIQNVGWAASANKQEAIIYQKWIALTGHASLEAYMEYQRTKFPVLPDPISIDPGAVSTFPPIRQYYPLSELTSNGPNLAKEGTINIFTTKIFWEK